MYFELKAALAEVVDGIRSPFEAGARGTLLCMLVSQKSCVDRCPSANGAKKADGARTIFVEWLCRSIGSVHLFQHY